VPIVLKSGSLNLLEPSGPLQACNEIALPLLFYLQFMKRRHVHTALVQLVMELQQWQVNLQRQLSINGITTPLINGSVKPCRSSQ
jgi:hypothetical protein